MCSAFFLPIDFYTLRTQASYLHYGGSGAILYGVRERAPAFTAVASHRTSYLGQQVSVPTSLICFNYRLF